jgi:mevalonate kinase
MAVSIEELCDRITESLERGAFDEADIRLIVALANRQVETLRGLIEDNQRLTEALEIAGKHIEKLEPVQKFADVTEYVEEDK